MTRARATSAPPRPAWRRLTRWHVLALHVIAYLIGGSFIWSLPVSTTDKLFDTCVWLAILAAHALVLFRRRVVVAWALHILTFSAGNAAIWYGTFRLPPDKALYTLVWGLVIAGAGVYLWRLHSRRAKGTSGKGGFSSPAKPKAAPKGKAGQPAPKPAPPRYPPPPPKPTPKPRRPAPEPVVADEAADAGYDDVTYEPVDDAYIDYDDGGYDEPPDEPPPRRRR